MKTPIEFDYDLWTTEDGKCMVRVKLTGEVTEVSREVMRILRADEKRMRRYFSSTFGKDKKSELPTVMSYDALSDEDVKESTWVNDHADVEGNVLADIFIEELCKELAHTKAAFFKECIVGDKSIRVFSREYGVGKTTLYRWYHELKEKIEKFF